MDVSLPVDIKKAQRQSSKKSSIQIHDLNESLQNRIHKWLMYVKNNLPGTFESSPDLSKYTFVVLSVMAMSAVLWGTIWKEGTFDEFIKHQYDRLNNWAEQKELQIKVLGLQRKGRKAKLLLKKATEDEANEDRAFLNFSIIWNKISSLSTSGIKQLWNSNLSWTALWSSWTLYFSDPFGIIPAIVPGMASKNVQFRILCVITVLKIVTYVYDLVTNKFSQIFDIYDQTFFPRVTLAILHSFIRILNSYVPANKQRESSLVQNQILALKATEENLSNLNVAELDDFIQDPVKYVTLKERIQKLVSDVNNLCDTKIEKIANGKSSYLKPIDLTKYAGHIEIPSTSMEKKTFFERHTSWASSTKHTYSMLNSDIFYSIWIKIAESIIEYDEIFRKIRQDNIIDEKTNQKSDITVSKKWTPSIDKLIYFQKFIKNKILENCNSIKIKVQDEFISKIPKKLIELAKIDFAKEFKEDSKDSDFKFDFDNSDDVNDFFISDTDRGYFASVLKKLKKITSSCDKKNIECYENEKQEAEKMLSVFETEIKNRKMTYVQKLRTIYNRNLFIIQLCGTMCRLLQYFISGYDAFLLASWVYADNKEVPNDILNFKQSQSHHRAILFSLQNYKSLNNSSTFITFQDAKTKIVNPLLDINELKIYVNRASILMCKIINADKIIIDVKDDDKYVTRIARLYAIENINECKTVPDCENCLCSKDDNISQFQFNDNDVIKSNLDLNAVDSFDSIVTN